MTGTPQYGRSPTVIEELKRLAKIGDELKEERDYMSARIGNDIVQWVERVRYELFPDASEVHKIAAQRWKGRGRAPVVQKPVVPGTNTGLSTRRRVAARVRGRLKCRNCGVAGRPASSLWSGLAAAGSSGQGRREGEAQVMSMLAYLGAAVGFTRLAGTVLL